MDRSDGPGRGFSLEMLCFVLVAWGCHLSDKRRVVFKYKSLVARITFSCLGAGSQVPEYSHACILPLLDQGYLPVIRDGAKQVAWVDIRLVAKFFRQGNLPFAAQNGHGVLLMKVHRYACWSGRAGDPSFTKKLAPCTFMYITPGQRRSEKTAKGTY